MINRLVLVGATGDLAGRYLLPGLWGLLASRRLPDSFGLLGVGRSACSTPDFRAFVRKSIVAARGQDATVGADRLAEQAAYLQWDPSAPDGLGAALGDDPALFYLAIPPWAFEPTVDAIARDGLNPGAGILVEKPFGVDSGSARSLNEALARAVAEPHIFRADHVLHHEGIRRFLDLRVADRALEQVWNREHVERVDITWYESGTPAGREDYYDRTGALLDMIQSHLLELLALVVMDLPADPDPEAFRGARVAALRDIKTPTGEDVVRRTHRATYEDGRIHGEPITAYRDLQGVEPDRRTETFASIEVRVESARWQGVPFALASGKAIGSNQRSIDVRFRPATPGAPGDGGMTGDGWTLRFPMPAGPRQVDRHDGRGWQALEDAPDDEDPTLTTSGRMLLGAIRGEHGWYLRKDEPLEGWRIVEPILDGWRSDLVPLGSYPAGGEPAEALRRDRA